MYLLLQQFKLRGQDNRIFDVANIFRGVLLGYNNFDGMNSNESIITQYNLPRDLYYDILKLGHSQEERETKMSMLYSLIKSVGKKH